MIVLQPLLLWGLALAGLPILIHLLNRLRFKTVPWGAMQFLLRLARYSSRSSRLRHYLILACRALALALLALAMARPLVGGWLGRLRGGSAEAVLLLLLDRSASMERRDAGGLSLREKAIEQIEQVPAELLRGSRIVFFDSAFRTAREVATVAAIRDLEWSAPTDTAAHWPALLEAAADWIDEQQPGRVDIWMLTDAQTSNWRPDSRDWQTLNRRLVKGPNKVRVRGLMIEAPDDRPNAAIQARAVAPQPDGSYELLYRLTVSAATDPLSAVLLTEGTRTQRPLAMPSALVDGGERLAGEGLGWAGIELPADANPADNAAWFVFGPAPDGVVWVQAENADARNRVRSAFRPARATDPHPARDWPRAGVPPLEDAALVVWQGAPPTAEAAAVLDGFIRAGGVLLALPPESESVPLADAAGDAWSWTAAEATPPERVWRVTEWEAIAGPFAQTIEGEPLPLGEIGIRRRVSFRAADREPIYAEARFADRYPLLVRMNRGGGRIYALTSLPLPEWSDLWDGRVWVPMLWRLREEGARRLGQFRMGICGAWHPDLEDGAWTAVDDDAPSRDARVRAGVYRCGNRLMALNRPEEEDDPARLTPAELQALLPEVTADVLRTTDGEAQPADVSGWLLTAAALCILAEGALALSLHGSRIRQWLRSG